MDWIDFSKLKPGEELSISDFDSGHNLKYGDIVTVVFYNNYQQSLIVKCRNEEYHVINYTCDVERPIP